MSRCNVNKLAVVKTVSYINCEYTVLKILKSF